MGSFGHRGLRYDFLRKKIWTVPLILQFVIHTNYIHSPIKIASLDGSSSAMFAKQPFSSAKSKSIINSILAPLSWYMQHPKIQFQRATLVTPLLMLTSCLRLPPVSLNFTFAMSANYLLRLCSIPRLLSVLTDSQLLSIPVLFSRNTKQHLETRKEQCLSPPCEVTFLLATTSLFLLVLISTSKLGSTCSAYHPLVG